MHNNTALEQFVNNAINVREKPEPHGVVRERQRQEALREKAAAVSAWRDLINNSPAADRIDGAKLGQLTDALGGVGFVSEVLGLRPDDIERAIKHSQGTLLSEKAVRQFITAAQEALRQNGEVA